MKISDIGEFGFIDAIKKNTIFNPKSIVVGIGDDGAVYKTTPGMEQIAVIDTMVENIVLIGRRTKKYTYPLLKNKAKVQSFDKPQQALKYLEKNLTGKETVIFKGSQYLEWIVEKLLAHPEDVSNLARQDEAHRRRRASWGLE